MRKSLVVIFALFISLYPCFLGAAPPMACSVSAPDIKGWDVVNESRIELRVSDNAVIYLGFEKEYKNPDDPDEFIRIISRHIPLLVLKYKQGDQKQFSETTALLYAQKEEQEHLNELSGKADPIIYIHWRTVKDTHAGAKMLNGDLNLWFTSAEGNCIFFRNEQVAVEFLTENIVNGRTHNVFSGVKYQVGSVYHILRVDRNDIALLFQEKH